MKPCLLLAWSAALLALLAAGCGQSDSGRPGREAPIAGRRSDPPASLKAEWKAGSRYLMHLQSQQSATLNFGPRPAAQETDISQQYALLVTNGPDGSRGIELEIQALAVEMNMGEQNVYRFDSLNKVTPHQGPGVEMLQRVIGGRIWFQLAADNTISKVEGIEQLVEQAQGDAGAGAPDQRRGWMGGVLQRIYNADYFKQMVDLRGLPPTPVRIGDTWRWERDIDVGLVGRILVVATNTFRGWQEKNGRKCARIDSQGVLGMKTGKAEGLLGFMGLKVENGRLAGKTWFDPAAGLPVETVMEQSCVIAGSAPAGARRGNPASNAPPRQISAPWRQTVTLTIEDVQPGAAPPPPR